MILCFIGDSKSVHFQSRILPFVQRGYTVHVVSEGKYGLPGVEEHSPMARSPHGLLGAVWAELATMWDHYRLVRDTPADVIHIHYAATIGAWLALAAGRPTPLVVSIMGGDVLDDEQMVLPRLARWMVSGVLRCADMVTGKTDELLDVASTRGVPRSQMECVSWGVDRNIFQPRGVDGLRRELGLAEEDRVILSPRILRPFYNIHIIVDALPGIVVRFPRAKLVLTEYRADKAYKARLKERIRELGIDSAVIWAGAVPHDHMAAFYSLADVSVAIPPSDGFPQSILESLACGTPVVAGRLERYDRIIREGDGLVLTELDVKSVADAVLSVVDDETTAAKLRRGGRLALESIPDLSMELDRMDEIYDRLVRQGRSGSHSVWVRWGCRIILAGLALRNGLRRGLRVTSARG